MGLFGFRKNKQKKDEDKMSKILDSMVEQLGYPYQILSKKLTPNQIMDIYREAFERGKNEGFTPVFLPEDEILEEYFKILKDEDGYSVEEALNKISDDGKEYLGEKLKDLTEEGYEDWGQIESIEEFLGEMENGCKNNFLVTMCDSSNKSMLPTVLLEVPTNNPWEVVAYIPFGGWNECPEPEKMATICKYWYEKYGAVPASITHDTLEFVLEKPISKEYAMEVAKEHFLFCPDRVEQCTSSGTIGEVADTLWQSKVWYFWWD